MVAIRVCVILGLYEMIVGGIVRADTTAFVLGLLIFTNGLLALREEHETHNRW